MLKNKNIYLDYSATTPVDDFVLKKMMPYFIDFAGNPSSAHYFGQTALLAVDEARLRVGAFFGCQYDEVVFTSGATEANNMCLRGVMSFAKKNGIKNPHLIISAIEHPSVLEVGYALAEEGVEVDIVGVDRTGAVKVEDVINKIKSNTILISVMQVNNETGVIQPIRKIGKSILKINDNRIKKWQIDRIKGVGKKPYRILFHTDATQAVQFNNCNIAWNYVDILTFSAHKVYGPKGAGALVLKTGVNIDPIIVGGGQERGLRAGTLNVAGIVGLGEAIANLTEEIKIENIKKIKELRAELVKMINMSIEGVVVNNSLEDSIPSVLNLLIKGVDSESLAIALDMKGVSVSTGSACLSHKLNQSHVLKAMGLTSSEIKSSLRVSLGKYSDSGDINEFARILKELVNKMRKKQ